MIDYLKTDQRTMDAWFAYLKKGVTVPRSALSFIAGFNAGINANDNSSLAYSTWVSNNVNFRNKISQKSASSFYAGFDSARSLIK